MEEFKGRDIYIFSFYKLSCQRNFGCVIRLCHTMEWISNTTWYVFAPVVGRTEQREAVFGLFRIENVTDGKKGKLVGFTFCSCPACVTYIYGKFHSKQNKSMPGISLRLQLVSLSYSITEWKRLRKYDRKTPPGKIWKLRIRLHFFHVILWKV